MDEQHTEIVRMLLENGADVKLIGREHSAGVISATKNKNFELVKLLVNAGADLNLRSIVSVIEM